MVDIIMPTYNPKSYIDEAIQSCLSQSHRNIKITVIDDCSNFDISYLSKKYPINLIRTPKNMGPAGARNFGIKNTNGDYISFLDDDDIMHKDKVLNSIKEFEKNNLIGMTCGNYRIFVNNRLRTPFYKKSPSISWNTLMSRNYVASGSVTLKRSVFNEIGEFNEKYWIGEDYDYWLRVSEKYPIKYIHKVLYYYRVVPGGNSLTQRNDIQKDHISNLEEIKMKSRERMNVG